MKAIIHEQLHQRGYRVFRDSDVKYYLSPTKDEDRLLKLHQEKQIPIIILDSKPLSKDFFHRLKQGSFLIRFGVGLGNLDLSICEQRNIEVFNVKDAHTTSAVEHAMGLLLALVKKIALSNEELKNNHWQKHETLELAGKTLAILGLGKTGLKLAKIAQLGFDLKVVGLVETQKRGHLFPHVDLVASDFREVLKNADFVSLHFNYKKKNHRFVNEEFLTKMKKNSFLINISRGDLIDEKILFQYLVEKRIAGAALDVFDNEPYENEQHDFRKLNNVILTPHIASNTHEANFKTAKEVEKIIKRIYQQKLTNEAI